MPCDYYHFNFYNFIIYLFKLLKIIYMLYCQFDFACYKLQTILAVNHDVLYICLWKLFEFLFLILQPSVEFMQFILHD